MKTVKENGPGWNKGTEVTEVSAFYRKMLQVCIVPESEKRMHEADEH